MEQKALQSPNEITSDYYAQHGTIKKFSALFACLDQKTSIRMGNRPDAGICDCESRLNLECAISDFWINRHFARCSCISGSNQTDFNYY